MPSGHSLNAMTLWGYVATRLKNRWVKIGFWLLIFLIGFSRMVLGVHMINDVLLGWVAGGILLLIFLVVEKKVQNDIHHWHFRKKLSWILVSTLILLAVPILIWFVNHDLPINNNWVLNFSTAYPEVDLIPYSLEGAVTAAATWMGLLLGLLILETKQISVSSSGKIWVRILRYLVGGIGVLIFWMGLKLIFPDGESFLALSLRFFPVYFNRVMGIFWSPILVYKIKVNEILIGQKMEVR